MLPLLLLLVGQASAEDKFLRRSSACVTPNGYTTSGCWETSEIVRERKYDGPRAMTVDTCFAFCNQAGNEVKYFGIAGGDKCWCAELFHGTEADEKCTTPCAGGGEGCGGPSLANVYIMYHCINNAEDQAAVDAEDAEKAAADRAKTIAGYIGMPEEACGQGDPVNVNAAETLVGSLDDCKLACGDSIECGGFTWEESMTRCVFHGDVDAGPREDATGSTCFSKSMR